MCARSRLQHLRSLHSTAGAPPPRRSRPTTWSSDSQSPLMAFHCGIAGYEVPSTLSGPTAPCGRLRGLYSLRQACAAQSAWTESKVQRGGLRLISPPQPTPETVILHSQPPGRRATPRTRICRRPSSPRARPSSRTDNLRRPYVWRDRFCTFDLIFRPEPRTSRKSMSSMPSQRAKSPDGAL